MSLEQMRAKAQELEAARQKIREDLKAVNEDIAAAEAEASGESPRSEAIIIEAEGIASAEEVGGLG